ncbi:MAG: M61 family metallopeptidase [Cyanobacteria bacterium J06638_22]
MTEATQTPPVSTLKTPLDLHYQIAMPHPESHLFEITLYIQGWRSPHLDLKMPVWTPGSYLVREYARHVQNFSAIANYQVLDWQKCSKNHWRIKTDGISDLVITYRLYANELTVRTNHLDSTHGYFNGAATFFYIPGYEQTPIRLTVTPPHADWTVATTLPAIADQPNTFAIADFDTLVDSPVEVGKSTIYPFEVQGKPHEWVIWGQGNYNINTLIADTQKIIEVESAIFDGLPYDRYQFLLHLSNQGYGGLEHKNSCTLNYSRFTFRSVEKYNNFMQLVAHEFFHLWNIKRIRPKALEAFDYDQENYTPSLWFAEGVTSYYDLLIPMRAGIYNARTFLKELSKELTRFLTTPGRRVQPLSESSFDAWIKLYRRDANSNNNQMSYYLKGAMVTLLLDLLIRSQHHNQRSMDDVLRNMWQTYGTDEIGFSPEQLKAVIESVADMDLHSFFYRCLETTDELPFEDYLAAFGLRLETDDVAQLPPFTGLALRADPGSAVVRFVEYGSPAQRAGLDAEDEILALDGLRVTANQWGDRLQNYQPGDTVEVTFFHRDELRVGLLHLAPPQPTQYHIAPLPKPSEDQESNLRGWLGVTSAQLRG